MGDFLGVFGGEHTKRYIGVGHGIGVWRTIEGQKD